MRTFNGGRAAVGTQLCTRSTTAAEREYILLREQIAKEFRKGLPRRKRPEHEKPGPITIIDMRGVQGALARHS